MTTPGGLEQQVQQILARLSALEVATIHRNADTDSALTAVHHSLGISPAQASPGDHTHDGRNSKTVAVSSLSGSVGMQILGSAASSASLVNGGTTQLDVVVTAPTSGYIEAIGTIGGAAANPNFFLKLQYGISGVFTDLTGYSPAGTIIAVPPVQTAGTSVTIRLIISNNTGSTGTVHYNVAALG